MFTDPIMHFPYAKQQHAELVRQGERERVAAHLNPRQQSLATNLVLARASLGGKIIRLGQLIQGVATSPTPAHGTR